MIVPSFKSREKGLFTVLWALSQLPCATAAAHSEAWTLESAERTALARSPRVRSAEAASEVAHAFRTFGTMPKVGNPVVSLRAMVGRPDAPAATYSLLLGLPIDIGGRRHAYQVEARHAIAEADARVRAVKNDVRAAVWEAYADVFAAEASRTVAEENAATARELLLSVEARFAAGTVTALDKSMAATQVGEALAMLERVERSLIRAQVAFRRVLDLKPEESAQLQPLAAPQLPAGLTQEAAIARALERRQEAAAWASARDRWRSADRRLRAEAVAPLVAGLDVEMQGNVNTKTSVGGSVSTELPLVLKNQGERAIARKEANAAEVERELTEHEIAREVAASYELLEGALSELAVLDERAMPEVDRTMAMIRTLLDSGAVDYFRLLTARSNAFALRRQRVEALHEAWIHRIELERATGGWESVQ